jgi:hypothetical protein
MVCLYLLSSTALVVWFAPKGTIPIVLAAKLIFELGTAGV